MKLQPALLLSSTQTTAAASTVGAIAGDMNLNADQTFTQRGSDVLAPGGDVNISAQRVTIEEAREAASSQTEQRFKQSGVTVAVTSPVLNAVQTAASLTAEKDKQILHEQETRNAGGTFIRDRETGKLVEVPAVSRIERRP